MTQYVLDKYLLHLWYFRNKHSILQDIWRRVFCWGSIHTSRFDIFFKIYGGKIVRTFSGSAGGNTGLTVILTLPMLSLLLHKTQRFFKPFKPCHVGIHWIVLTEYSQMSTYMPGFQSFFRFFASFCIGQFSHQRAAWGLRLIHIRNSTCTLNEPSWIQHSQANPLLI